MEEKTVHIPNISCDHCVMTIKNELSEIDSVEFVDGEPSPKNITVRWRSSANGETTTRKIDEIGYTPED